MLSGKISNAYLIILLSITLVACAPDEDSLLEDIGAILDNTSTSIEDTVDGATSNCNNQTK